MEYSLLGPAGVKLSKICLGTATLGVAPMRRDQTSMAWTRSRRVGLELMTAAITPVRC